MAPPIIPVRERISRFLLVPVDENECWEWRGFIKPEGYGQFWYRGTSAYAHRVSYEVFVGKIPEGCEIDHLCRNRKCVNPRHLEAVTPRENTLRGDGIGAKNARKTHCIRGHPFSGANLQIDHKGKRVCRECRRLRKRKGWATKTMIEGQMDIWEVIDLVEAEDVVETPYFDGEGNEGTIDEVYS